MVVPLVRVEGHFNPRTREGCDPFRHIADFQIIVDFNPRTREGCDLKGN